MNYEIFETRERILANNDEAAAETRRLLKEKRVFLVNLMGSPGAGKTSTLLQIIKRLGGKYRIGVMEADADSDVDAKTISETGVRTIQLHSGGLCHMDADMTSRGMNRMGIDGLDLLFLENIGNLVCPAEFEIGADLRLVVLSVPEGDDKPLKYPLMFTIGDCVLVNKIDTAPVFDFDIEALKPRVLALNPNSVFFPVSAETEEGFDEFCSWLSAKIDERRAEYEADRA
jgi:hydrogenase nickel incorporation protein HypB